jgi:hypothetical protein
VMEREERTSTADIASRGEIESREDESVLDDETEGLAEEKGEQIDKDDAQAPAADADQRDDTEDEERGPLLGDETTSDVRSRWTQIQGSFVDEPRRAVEEADSLVAELMQKLADSFSQERQRLEGQWDRGDEVSTEDLRIALQRYRSFFDRLLSA